MVPLTYISSVFNGIICHGSTISFDSEAMFTTAPLHIQHLIPHQDGAANALLMPKRNILRHYGPNCTKEPCHASGVPQLKDLMQNAMNITLNEFVTWNI